MKLAYLDLAPGDPVPGAPSDATGPGGGVAAVVLHREADATPGRAVGVVRATGLVGRVVFPFGGYAFYPSGMEVGGVCWYRVLPGYEGTDPISLATAVVQVCDLLDDLALQAEPRGGAGRVGPSALDGPMVVGFGQGAVVALGAALVRPDLVGSVVAVDPYPGHVALLPPASPATAGPTIGGAVPAGAVPGGATAADSAAMPARPAPVGGAVPGAGGAVGVGGAASGTAAGAVPVLLAGTAPEAAPYLDRVRELLAGRGVTADTWCLPEGSGEDHADEALPAVVREWFGAARAG